MGTNITTPDPLAISKDDLGALRWATTVVFESYIQDEQRLTRIRAIRNKRTYDDSPVFFTRREQIAFPTPFAGALDERMRVVPAAAAWTFYHGGDEDLASGFAMIGSSLFTPEWLTIASLLRPDDKLVLAWVANNDNDHTRNAGLNRDELHLSVHRGDARALRFLLAVSVGANNSARMVKPMGARGLQ